MRTIISIALSIGLLTPVFAGPVSMVCQNPRQEYLAVFDPETETFIINPETDRTQYHVVTVEFLGVVSGQADPESGLDFKAHFFGPSRIEYSVDGRPAQTDRCRNPQPHIDNTPMDIEMGN